MNINTTILELGKGQNTFTVNDVLRKLSNKYSRVYILRFIQKLLEEGIIRKSGTTRASQYALTAKAEHLTMTPEQKNNIRQQILDIAKKQAVFTANDILKSVAGSFTRAYILRFIGQLLTERVLVKSGSTRGAIYSLAGKVEKFGNRFSKRYINKDLSEDQIWESMQKQCSFIPLLNDNVRTIFSYAFTEMLNNAIDHSRSRYVGVKVDKLGNILRFVIDDFGIGAWNNIMQKRGLSSELEAAQDLLKGKTTTAPLAHSGEGIFFTSKVGNTFSLQSGTHELRIDNQIHDVFITKLKPKKNGTRVIFELHENHKGTLNDVFKKYYTDPENLAFDKTEIQIKLYTLGSIYVSRSQARRVLSGLEKFKTIILDFDKVSGVGQAFADEIFRVFKSRHRDITIQANNMNESVNFMVQRVEKPR